MQGKKVNKKTRINVKNWSFKTLAVVLFCFETEELWIPPLEKVMVMIRPWLQTRSTSFVMPTL